VAASLKSAYPTPENMEKEPPRACTE
jgi:hypothetical protein